MTTIEELEAVQQQYAANQMRLLEGLNRQLEEHLSVLGDLIDPKDALRGPDGELWLPLTVTGTTGFAELITDAHLAQAREIGRTLAMHNEFAISGHENRISYTVGWGFTYKATAKSDENPSPELIKDVQRIVDEFIKVNRWHHKQQEIVYRRDRDGECFLRFFAPDDGILRVRFIEPERVVTPSSGEKDRTLGVETDPDDIETVVAYWLADGFGGTAQQIPAEQIQHRKRNVDSSCKRGWPTFVPVRKNLQRAAKILRNMNAVAEIQSAIAIVRKHAQATKTATAEFVRNQTTSVVTGAGGQTEQMQKFSPGTILDANQNIDYEFPAGGIDPSKYVSGLQADLRAVAARLVMPEFMLTSDASNANFASTMVAEGPAVKNFQRLQWDEATFDREIMERLLSVAVDKGRLPATVLEQIEIQIEPPTVQVRDRLKEAQTGKLLVEGGVLSLQTFSTEMGYDYDKEQQQIEEHDERVGNLPPGERPGLPLDAGFPSDQQPGEQPGQQQDRQLNASADPLADRISQQDAATSGGASGSNTTGNGAR